MKINKDSLEARYIEIVKNTTYFMAVSKLSEKYFNKRGFNWYIGAGSAIYPVWNSLHGFQQYFGISDIDIVYYDIDINEESEKKIAKEIKTLLPNLNFDIDVVNQARVHVWYESEFGIPIKQYNNIEEAISHWPSTASSIGVRLNKDEFEIFSPFGLDDLFNLCIRPNKKLISKEKYVQKANKWKRKWPKLEIIKW